MEVIVIHSAFPVDEYDVQGSAPPLTEEVYQFPNSQDAGIILRRDERYTIHDVFRPVDLQTSLFYRLSGHVVSNRPRP